VTFSCILCSVCTYYVVLARGHATPLKALHVMGCWPIDIVAIARNMLLVLLLYTGPLYERGIIDGCWRDWSRGTSIRETLGGWIGWRNYVMGPVTEEILFRTCIVSVHILARFTPKQIIFYTPLYFAFAHVHHFYEYTLTHPHSSVTPALLRSLFQLGFTSLFGAFASFVYLRTASLPSVILIHAFANWGGLPRIWGAVTPPEKQPLSPLSPITKEKVESDAKTGRANVKPKHATAWTASYYVMLVAGAYGFYKGLWPLTESAAALVSC